MGIGLGVQAIEPLGDRTASNGAPRLCLVFAPGSRPDLAALEALVEAPQQRNLPGFIISHRSPDQRWAELLADGLTFDCTGLAPHPGDLQPPAGPPVGLRAMPAGEVVSLAPGPHLAGAAALLPVLRILAGIGARLATLPGIKAVIWTPASAWVSPDLFQRVVSDWLEGGAFPGLVLTALERERNGAMVSRGLGLLTGQEVRFEPDKRLTAAAMARLAVRLIHELVQTGRLTTERDFAGPAGEHLLVVPVRDGTQVRVIVSTLGENGGSGGHGA